MTPPPFMKTTSTTKANRLDGRTAQPGRASRFASAPTCSLSQVVWVVSNCIEDHGTLDGAGGVGGLLATEVGGVWYFPLYDNNGNITDYVSETGEVVASYAYDAFGRTIAQSGAMASVFPFRFSTKYYDAESGLYYYCYRNYSPDLGRWITRDPIEEDGGDNLYAFCGNNGMNRIDAWGLEDNWTEDSAIEYLEDTMFVWQLMGWDFAADALLHFLANTDRNADLSRHYKTISDDNSWQNAFIGNVASKIETGAPAKEIGDIAHRKNFSENLDNRSFQNDNLFDVMFNYRFYPGIGCGWHLFFAMFGARFSYVGSAAKRKVVRDSIRTYECCDEVEVNMDVATWDATTYPGGRWREKSKAYRAAMFLENHAGYSQNDYIYLRWHESGTWKRCKTMQGNSYREDTSWKKVK